MITESKKTMVSLTLSLMAFISFVVYILYINQEVFYTAHERSEYLPGSTFLTQLLSKPFGLMQYIGAWFTQYFYIPALGSTILATIWVLIFLVGKKAFRLQGGSSALMLIPITCLLTSVVDLGYWIYIYTIRGYWFSQSLAYLLTLVLLWIANSTPRKWHLCWYIFGVCLYPVLGWFALLFILCLVLSEKLSWRELVGVILLLLSAYIWRTLLYSHLNLENVSFAGLPRFVTAGDKTDHLTTPFWILGGVSVLIPLCHRYLAKWFVPALCSIIGIAFTSSLMFQDKNYIDEMRISRNALDDNWQEVLNIYEEVSEPTRSMIILKNIALMKEGGLLDKSFAMGNIGKSLYNPDSIHVSFLEIAAPVSYYNYGMLNEGFRLSFECAVQGGFSPYYLKMLARCANANGEDHLAQRYISVLHAHPFYKDWQPGKVSEQIIDLHQAYPDELTGVEDSDGYLVNNISQWNKSDSKLASEQAVLYSMLRCDSRRFWLSLRKFVKLHMDEEFPLHAMEAYIMYMEKAPEEKRMMLPVSKEVYDRYVLFWDTLKGYIESGTTSKDEVGRLLRKDFGDTYWYYNVFNGRTY